jgi:DNA polymerase beta
MISAILKIKFDICGSYRRGALESGDVDILISQNDGDLKKIVKKLQKNNIIIDSLTTEGSTKFMGIYRINDMSALALALAPAPAPVPAPARRIDIRLVSPDSYYAALLYFTGNKNFNIYLRQKAIDNGYTLNEYGLKFNDELRVLKSENEIFEILNISVIDPEKRT